MASNINGVTKMVINKMDILEELNVWRMFDGVQLYEFENSEDMQHWIEENVASDYLEEIFFSRSPEYI